MEEAFSNHRLNYEQQIEVSSHKVQRLEEMLRNCTRDYILSKNPTPYPLITIHQKRGEQNKKMKNAQLRQRVSWSN